MAFKKTLAYLTDDQLKALRLRARASGRSVAAVMRDAVASYLGSPERSPLEDLIGCASGEPDGDTSERADEILERLLG